MQKDHWPLQSVCEPWTDRSVSANFKLEARKGGGDGHLGRSLVSAVQLKVQQKLKRPTKAAPGGRQGIWRRCGLRLDPLDQEVWHFSWRPRHHRPLPGEHSGHWSKKSERTAQSLAGSKSYQCFDLFGDFGGHPFWDTHKHIQRLWKLVGWNACRHLACIFGFSHRLVQRQHVPTQYQSTCQCWQLLSFSVWWAKSHIGIISSRNSATENRNLLIFRNHRLNAFQHLPLCLAMPIWHDRRGVRLNKSWAFNGILMDEDVTTNHYKPTGEKGFCLILSSCPRIAGLPIFWDSPYSWWSPLTYCICFLHVRSVCGNHFADVRVLFWSWHLGVVPMAGSIRPFLSQVSLAFLASLRRGWGDMTHDAWMWIQNITTQTYTLD